MPDSLQPYSSTPVFDETTLPKALQDAHSTKAGTWGVLELIAGNLAYIVEDTGALRILQTGDRQLIEPQQLHHVELIGSMQMQVHFYCEKPIL